MPPDFVLLAQHRSFVTTAARIGLSVADICVLFTATFAAPIAEDELQALFAEELRRAALVANLLVGTKLYDKAVAGDTAAMIYWTKARMGWSDRAPAPAKASEPENPAEPARPWAVLQTLPDGKQMARILRTPRRSSGRSSD